MLATNLIKSQNVDPELILLDPENKLLLTTLLNFSEILKRYGFDVKVCNARSLYKLTELSTEGKRQIRQHFENWATWIEPESFGEGLERISLAKEKAFLKRALDHYGLWIHEEFWDVVREGQVIEVYGANMVQLYRNIHFFQYSSYSLLEISVFEWHHLWQRPRAIQASMMDAAVKALNKMTPLMAYDVPRHVLRESKENDTNADHELRACLVDFKYIGSVCRGLAREPAGAIAVSEAELIAIGDEALQIQFV